MLTLCCAVGFAFHIFYTGRFVKNEDGVLLTIVQMVTAAVISWITVLFKGETSFTLASEGLLPLLYLGIFQQQSLIYYKPSDRDSLAKQKRQLFYQLKPFGGWLFQSSF
ncbi:hypothetical protein ACI2OX_16690 [Bacillus sp. N9]